MQRVHRVLSGHLCALSRHGAHFFWETSARPGGINLLARRRGNRRKLRPALSAGRPCAFASRPFCRRDELGKFPRAPYFLL